MSELSYEEYSIKANEIIENLQVATLNNTDTWSQGNYTQEEIDFWRTNLTSRDCQVLSETLQSMEDQRSIKKNASTMIYLLLGEDSDIDLESYFSREASKTSDLEEKNYLLGLRVEDYSSFPLEARLATAERHLQRFVEAGQQQHKNLLLLSALKSRAESEETEDRSVEE
jgi:hypothetical protein